MVNKSKPIPKVDTPNPYTTKSSSSTIFVLPSGPSGVDGVAEASLPPNELLYQFLEMNHLKLVVTVIEGETPFIGERGFVLTDKPLLVVSAVIK